MTLTPALPAPLAEALAARGYATLTPVQLAVTEPSLADADLLVSAQTGSGKTVGFGLAIAGTLLGEETRFGPAAAPLGLVIAPTRELAMQVRRELEWLYAGTGAVLASCVGGMDMRDERRALDRGAHIVVATPGRLRDHLTRGSLDLGDLRAVVLDEADEMLDLGFREDLEFILGAAPEGRRTLMFSATVPRAIAKLAESYQKDARRISTAGERAPHADIDYRALSVATADAENAVVNVLRYYESQNAIVFGNTRAMVARLTTRLSNRGFAVVALSGELSQQERTHALQALRDGRARVCVATDVAARGIDLPNLDLVIHAELPTAADTLLHRSGRTGRAGRKGVSALIVPPAARRKAENLLRFARVEATWDVAPGAEAVLARDEDRLLGDAMWSDAPAAADRALIERLAGSHDSAALAAAVVRLFRAGRTAPEDLAPQAAWSGPGTRPAATAPRDPAGFGPTVWFAVAAGRNQRAEPRRLLPMLCRAGNITRTEIGAIRVQGDETHVEIAQSAVAHFLDALGPLMVLEGGIAITEMTAPAGQGQPRPQPGHPSPSQDHARSPQASAARQTPPAAPPAPSPAAPPAPPPAAPPAMSPAAPPRPAPREEEAPRQFTGARAAREFRAQNPKPAPKPLPVHLRKADLAAPAKPARPARPVNKPPRPAPGGWTPESAPPPAPRNAGAGTGEWPATRAATPSGPGAKPAGKPFGKPGGKPYGKPGGPGGTPTGKPAGKVGGKPAGKAGGKPAGKAGGKGGKPVGPRPGGMDTPRRKG